MSENKQRILGTIAGALTYGIVLCIWTYFVICPWIVKEIEKIPKTNTTHYVFEF